MIRVAVLGASGYTGAETLRWVLGHPDLELVGATANKHAGKKLSALWPSLNCDITLTTEPPAADAYFLCLPHGEAAKLAPQLSGKIIDLSGDHRLNTEQTRRWYKLERPTEPWLYGLPELGHQRYAEVDRVANPGCFATALALALLPMHGALPPVVQAVGLTGSTGSGASPTEGTHHPTRAENLRPYKDKVLKHQHAPEVENALGGGFRLDFVPISAPLRRGILVTVPLAGATAERYLDFYAGNPLVRVCDAAPDTLSVLGSPRADLGVVEGEDGQAVVFCAIDNLCRGAGSQAVVNLNLLMGWEATRGMRHLPPVP